MTVIGFDVSKHELVGVLTNRSAVVKKTFVLANTKPTIETFLDQTAARYPAAIIASEATAEYHRTLALACLRRNIPFRLLNPIVTKQFTTATVRKKKTDLTDALIIAKCVLQGEGTAVTLSHFAPAKAIDRARYRLSELSQALCGVYRRFSEVLPEEKEVAGAFRAVHTACRQSMTKLETATRQRIDAPLHALLCSLTGVGPTLASTFVTEIGDITRFQNQKSLVAYAGLDPRVKQSGVSLKRNTHLTKRGSPYLRRAAFIAASIAQRHDPELKAYYEKKRNEGKRYREATIANARHIMNRVYAVWKRGTPYVKNPA